MLCAVHTFKTDQPKPSEERINNSDGDDVYFRFGGATLCSMLHLRYKNIKKCSIEKRDVTSKEIEILQSINTRDKDMLPQYLRYRDKVNIYSPHLKFISFFRAVDEYIKEVVNEARLHSKVWR